MQPSEREPRTGKNAVVTGGTDGIGKEVARGLAAAGHSVVLVGRDGNKGTKAAQELAVATGSKHIQFVRADLSLMREVDRLATDLRERLPVLHYLVHSAGVVHGYREITDEGIESNFAINYLSRFKLTLKLLPVLEAAGLMCDPARVLTIGGAAQNGVIHFEDVNLTRKFATLRAVFQFCRANDLFTVELARRLSSSIPIEVYCLKIGVVKTNIRREFPGWMKMVVPLLDALLGQPPQAAASAALRLLLTNEFLGTNGFLFLKIKELKRIAPSADFVNRELGERLWKLSEQLTSITINGNSVPQVRQN
jgi:NAD(P)-dependent dehydrogenase (short-subunit alcohol dehydrogenase family)